MEGFKEQMVRDLIKLPKRYQIASIVSFGYEEGNADRVTSARFPFGMVLRVVDSDIIYREGDV